MQSLRRPDLLEEEITIPMLIRFGFRIRLQVHYLPIARRIVGWPMGKVAAIGISGPGKVRPVGLHQLRKPVVLRRKSRSVAQGNVAEDVFDLVGVECSGRDRMKWISRRRLRKVVAIDGMSSVFKLSFEPSPGGVDQEVVTSKIISRALRLNVTIALIQLEEFFRAGAKDPLRRDPQFLRGMVLILIPAGQQRHMRLLAGGINSGNALRQEIAIDIRPEARFRRIFALG